MLKRLIGIDSDQQARDADELQRAISEFALFQGLPDEAVGHLVPALRVKRFADEEIHCHCSDAQHDAFLVLDGKVGITFDINAGVHTIDLAGTGTLFNIGGLLALEQRQRSARALGECRLIAIDTAMLRRLAGDNAKTGAALFREVARLMTQQADRELENVLA